MNIIVFDTETISLEKSFIYNVGWVVADLVSGQVVKKVDLVIRQIYDNKPLFATAYYSNKRPLYTNRMKGKKTLKVSWGEMCHLMLKDIKEYKIENVYAYNSAFDTKAFYFNHLFFRNKVRPLDYVKVNDIMDYIKIITTTQEYKNFCKENNFLTKHSTPRPKQTAESVYAFITNNKDYKEEHTALQDSIIEYEILKECILRDIEKSYL